MAVVLMEGYAPQDSALIAEVPGKGVEVVVHINEPLDESGREELKRSLEQVQGINDVEFCPNRFHLMLVTYDSEITSSKGVLKQVMSLSVHAQLVGPI